MKNESEIYLTTASGATPAGRKQRVSLPRRLYGAADAGAGAFHPNAV